jgi:LuxR family transcriptional regulator of csgAB operon
MQPKFSKIQIVGPRRVDNELIASFLTKELDIMCSTQEKMVMTIHNTNKTIDNPPLVLLDCCGNHPEKILTTVKSYVSKKQGGGRLVLFNIPRGIDIEPACVEHGVHGFFYCDDDKKRFVNGIKVVLDGDFWISRKVMSEYIKRKNRKKVWPEGTKPELSSREKEVLSYVSVGLTNAEIADKLCISPHTVKCHLYNLYKKIKVPNRFQASLWAAKNL